MAVMAMAISTGKKIATTGMSRVPRPNPEKRVRVEAVRAAAEIIMKSIGYSYCFKRSRKVVRQMGMAAADAGSCFQGTVNNAGMMSA
jgi:hypothetical protein